ncbi:hybrid sensor histidine kinase/response regulator [Hydrogenophaga crocea]|nr:hybrid sensor histidine kinase/response regulator [Hydrogenophaga crocea]
MNAAPAPIGIDERVHRAQVAALFRNLAPSTLADVAIAWSMVALYWWQLREPGVLVWWGLHILQTLRYPLLGRWHRDPQAAERSAHWARVHVREHAFYSLTWGLAPWCFLPAGNQPLTALLMLVILGICSAGVPAMATRWASVLAFTVPMVLGLASALLWQGDTLHAFLAGCCLVYLGATLLFARNLHRLLTEALHTRFEKEALAEQLAEQMAITRRASEDKTRFFAAASHDLRQPLHAIALFGAVIERELKGRSALAHAQRLMGAVRALGASLDTMLDVSRLDAGVIEPEPQALALADVFTALLPLFANRAEEAGLQLRIRATGLWVRSDPQLLLRLLANLVENAIKYTPRGGVLVVARLRGRRVWVEVIDTGIGIAPEHAGRVFDEFYQVDNPGRDRTRGLGMGLAIVRRLAALLEHPIALHSHPGRGTRFRIELPLAEAPPARAPLPLPAEPADQRALPQRVLLIDDEADIAQATGALLGGWGVQLTAVDGEARAAEALATQAFDALICDFRLADGADGLQVAQRLRERYAPGLPLLLVTGETAPERLQRLRDAGLPVLYKPVDPLRLRQALADLMAP